MAPLKTARNIAEDVIHRIGGKATLESRLKKTTGWFVEQLGRLKLNDSILRYSDLSRVVELETLAAAAQERIALWDSLDAVASDDSRLDGITFSFFRKQALRHLDDLNSRRRFASADAFFGGEKQT